MEGPHQLGGNAFSRRSELLEHIAMRVIKVFFEDDAAIFNENDAEFPRFISEYVSNALSAHCSAGHPASVRATFMYSTNSSKVAPASKAIFVYPFIQGSHFVATTIAKAERILCLAGRDN